jgi:Kef-type K+ transport system membrane component KefB
MTKTLFLEELGEIGVIFLMFIAGLETEVEELKESGKSSSLIALGGVLIPGILASSGAYFITQDMFLSLFLGLISTATSVSISVQTLREIGHLRSKEGIAILGAAIIDDVIGIILLTVAVGFFKPTAGSSLLIVISKIVLFFVLVVIIGKVINFILIKLSQNAELDEKIVSLAVIVCLMLAFMSEEMGVAAITGAYFSGVVFSMTDHRHRVSHEINKMATVFFTPIFFVVIGMGVDLTVAFSAIGVGSIIISLAILGKIIGSGLGAKLSGFENNQALQIGIGMIPRAEVAIIIANLGLNLGLINNHAMAVVILMVVITTLITPTLLKWSFGR